MKQFDQDIALNSVAEGQYQGKVESSYNIGTNPNGGYLLALAAHALAQESAPHAFPLSITAHYQRPGVGGVACEIATQKIRQGKSLSTSRATLFQEGKARLELLASYGDLAAPDTNVTPAKLSVAAPLIDPPDRCISRDGKHQGVFLPITERLDIRLHPAHARMRAVDAATALTEIPSISSGWVRFRDGRDPDPLALLLFADAFPPAIFGLLGLVGWVPTIELTVHVRRRPAAGWIQAQFVTTDLSDGRLIEDGLLWDSQGHLVARSRQLAMLLQGSKD